MPDLDITLAVTAARLRVAELEAQDSLTELEEQMLQAHKAFVELQSE